MILGSLNKNLGLRILLKHKDKGFGLNLNLSKLWNPNVKVYWIMTRNQRRLESISINQTMVRITLIEIRNKVNQLNG